MTVGALVLLNGVGLLRRAAVRGQLPVDLIPVDFVASAALLAVHDALQVAGPPTPVIQSLNFFMRNENEKGNENENEMKKENENGMKRKENEKRK